MKAVKKILDSTVSHAIVANLNTNDRCFLVENLIGDFQFDQPSDSPPRTLTGPIKTEESIKSSRYSKMSEEMIECFITNFVLPPYAGSYLFYLMSKIKEI